MRGNPIRYSSAELKFIRRNSKLSRKRTHRLFVSKFKRYDISESNIKNLCKRKNWLTGRTGCFEKGHIPHPKARPNGPNRTSFKKGHKPHNWKPVHSTRLSKDGYLEIKIKEPNVWEKAQIILWEKYHGKVPSGFCVTFKDGIKTHIALDNLELLNRNELFQINSLQCSSYPGEIRPVVKTLGKMIAAKQKRENV